MLFSFLLFLLIGFIPYISAFFALEISIQQTKRLLPTALIYFFFYSIFKLFASSFALTELQGHNIQTFIFSLVVNSFEFVAFRYAFVQNKVKNSDKGKTITFWWAFISSFITTILTFISNSRTYELEPHHISYSLATLSYLFLMFAMQNLSLSISQFTKISNLSASKQLFVLLLGIPGAITSVDASGIVPLFVPDVLKVCASALLWFISRFFSLPEENKTAKTK
ncbi:hypothetical protein M9Y10_039566 [Tritrichomonas musculus]|uniref:PQ loop repeat family protein n=1 Tax=Tritrichomonas musculus TaxID=1915356 RepID=A0ABR2KBK8_9EUKA